jgi:SAM-dependent methyltransferase
LRRPAESGGRLNNLDKKTVCYNPSQAIVFGGEASVSEAINRVHEQCVCETELAQRLRAANRLERRPMYGEIADEYTRRFPEHLPKDSARKVRTAGFERRFLARFLAPTMTVAEIGPGRCHLAFSLAPLVGHIYGIDVASGYVDKDRAPANFDLMLTDGIHLPPPTASVDLVISNQLMEHLHPEDAIEQLHEIHRILKPGGGYVCVTPSCINGPHDCSAYFDDLPCPIRGKNYAATGLHLKEYTTREIVQVFLDVGFREVQTWIGARGYYVSVPTALLNLIEAGAQLAPAELRKRSPLLGTIVGNRLYAVK